MDEQRVREIVREELAANHKAPVHRLMVRTVIDPQISENSHAINIIVNALKDHIIPTLNLHHQALQNLCDSLDELGQLLEQPSKGN